MIKKVTYVAFDGSEFESEKDCLDYENATTTIFDKLIMWNAGGRRIEPDERTAEALGEALESCEYLFITDGLTWEEECILRDTGITAPTEQGRYYWDIDEWVNYADTIENMLQRSKIYFEMEHMVEG